MEKITMNDVIAFVKKAIQNDLKVDIFINNISISDANTGNEVSIDLNGDELNIETKSGFFTIENLSNKEILQYTVLCEDVRSYQENKGIREFKLFFKEDESKPSDINDLDDNDD